MWECEGPQGEVVEGSAWTASQATGGFQLLPSEAMQGSGLFEDWGGAVRQVLGARLLGIHEEWGTIIGVGEQQ